MLESGTHAWQHKLRLTETGYTDRARAQRRERRKQARTTSSGWKARVAALYVLNPEAEQTASIPTDKGYSTPTETRQRQVQYKANARTTSSGWKERVATLRSRPRRRSHALIDQWMDGWVDE